MEVKDTEFARALLGYMDRAGVEDLDELADLLGEPFNRAFLERTIASSDQETNPTFWLRLGEALELAQEEREDLYLS